MRVTTRATTRSTHARWGARCVGLGLTTALAVTLAASPASAQAGPQLDAEVAPVEVAGNPNCDDITPPLSGFTEVDTNDTPVDGETLNFSVNGTTGSITIGFGEIDTPEAVGQVLDFDITGPFAAAAVIVKGGPVNEVSGANLYDYRLSMAGQIAADETLHAQLNAMSPSTVDFHDISHVAFCIVPDEYNT